MLFVYNASVTLSLIFEESRIERSRLLVAIVGFHPVETPHSPQKAATLLHVSSQSRKGAHKIYLDTLNGSIIDYPKKRSILWKEKQSVGSTTLTPKDLSLNNTLVEYRQDNDA